MLTSDRDWMNRFKRWLRDQTNTIDQRTFESTGAARYAEGYREALEHVRFKLASLTNDTPDDAPTNLAQKLAKAANEAAGMKVVATVEVYLTNDRGPFDTIHVLLSPEIADTRIKATLEALNDTRSAGVNLWVTLPGIFDETEIAEAIDLAKNRWRSFAKVSIFPRPR